MVRLADAGDLTLRIYAMVDCPPLNGYCRDQVPRLENYANGFLSVRSVKLFADGALGSWGAAMIEDYEDKPGNRGSMLLEYERLEELVRKVYIPPTFLSSAFSHCHLSKYISVSALLATALIPFKLTDDSGMKQAFKSTSTQSEI